MPQDDPTTGQLFEPRAENRPEPPEVWIPRLEQLGRELGFARVGFTSAAPFMAAAPVLRRWLDNGYHADLAYLDQVRHDPARLLNGARSMIVVALPHKRPTLAGSPSNGSPLSNGPSGKRDDAGPTGYVAAYAGGDDYHYVIKHKLLQLAQHVADVTGHSLRARACVDTAPLLEREAARRAGIAFTGKSTLSIIPGVGSYVLLGELLLDLALPTLEPTEDLDSGTDHQVSGVAPGCGSCTACLDVCPTGALVEAYTLDARRCISYLTIENREAIPAEHRSQLGAHIFGCDLCQAVCPYNHSRKLPPGSPDLAPRAGTQAPPLLDWLTLGSAGYRRLVSGSALSRVSRPRLQRNLVTALGNSGDPGSVPALIACLRENPSSLVRGHAAWALGQLGGAEAASALCEALLHEVDEEVCGEIRAATGWADG
ncbi:MAG: putative iron-sulfur cluster binding protein [Pseudomonadota bacterium]|jgi:epoxyqueuosine reductase